jgi:hypothetical protein
MEHFDFDGIQPVARDEPVERLAGVVEQLGPPSAQEVAYWRRLQDEVTWLNVRRSAELSCQPLD